MRKTLAVVATLVGSFLIPTIGAPSAWAACAPDGPTTVYTISAKSYVYQPTNVYSGWESLSHGGTITYNQTATATTSAAISSTVSAEAGVIFAKASTSFSLTLGKSWSESKSWSYSANTPPTTTQKFRVHLYRYSTNFTVTKQVWVAGKCAYVTSSGYPSKVTHAPASASDENYNVWKLDTASA